MINRQLLTYPDQFVARLSKMEKQINDVARRARTSTQNVNAPEGRAMPMQVVDSISNEEIRRIVERSN